MKYLLFSFALLVSNFLTAGDNFTDYKNHIATDRFLIVFNGKVSSDSKAKFIEGSGLVKSYTHLPSPALTICFTADIETAQKYFSALPEVEFVSFFITDGKDHYAGVLDDFFVKLADKNFESALQAELKKENLGAAVADKYVPNLYRVHNSQSQKLNTVDWCARFVQYNWVSYASPNYLLNPIVPAADNDPLYNDEWNIHNTGASYQGSGTSGADMKVDTAWSITTGDPNIKVAVIDAGVDTTHPDLRANLLPGHDAIDDSFNTYGYPYYHYQDDGHGTCCAGIIAAIRNNNIGCTGVAPSCKIIPVHVFYYILLQGASAPLPYSTAAAFADAIGWSWDTAHADILSNSWGLPPALISFLPGGLQPVDDAIATAYTNGRNGKGIAMFFSSGNDNDSIGPIWPSSLPQSISVGATNMCDKRKEPGDCSGENWGDDFGPYLDFSAPGVRITTTDMVGAKGFSGNSYYNYFNGTSAACPNAAAVGALLLSIRPDFTPDDVRNVIAQTCDKVGGYAYDSIFQNGTWCNELGYGRVNAYRALQLASLYNAISPVNELVGVNIFPNPTNSVLNIEYQGNAEGWIKMYDMAGKEITRHQLHRGLNSQDVSLLSGGIYLVRIDTETGTATKKIAIFR